MFFLDLIQAVLEDFAQTVLEKLWPKARTGSITRKRGDLAEDFALAFLAKQGFKLIERNLGDEKGELDLVGRQRGFDGIVVVEVRARRKDGKLSPRESVNRRKQKQVVKTARRLLKRKGLSGPARFDIVGVWLNEKNEPLEAERFENAFR